MQKNKRGDIEKWYQTESPEIPDRGETSQIPGLPSGDISVKFVKVIACMHSFTINAELS